MMQKIILLIYTTLIIIAYSSCRKEESHSVTSRDELYVYLDSLEMRYETACRQMQLAQWNMVTKEGPSDLNAARAEFKKIFSDTTIWKIITEWRSRSSSLADKLLGRRLDLWYRTLIGGSIDFDPEITERAQILQQRIANVKYIVHGKILSVAQFTEAIRKEIKQSKRHKLWRATLQRDTSIINDYINLIKLYNDKARSIGFPNYYSLTLFLQAIDEKWLIRTFTYLDEFSRPEFEKFIVSAKKKFHMKEFGPWDIEFVRPEVVSLPDKYFLPDSLLSILQGFERGIGFMIDTLPIRETIARDLDGEGCFIMSIPESVRLRIRSGMGFSSYEAGLYSYGKALQAVTTNVSYPILKGYEWISGSSCLSFSEGTALTHSNFVKDSLWLVSFTKMKEKELRPYLNKRSLQYLFELRKEIKAFKTEYEIFKNPEINLDSLEMSTMQKFLVLDTLLHEELRFLPSPSSIFSPCNSHSNVMKAMIAAQLHDGLTSKFGIGKITNQKVAGWMIENLYKSGETAEWYERIRNATGKSLEPGALLRYLRIERMNLPPKESQE